MSEFNLLKKNWALIHNGKFLYVRKAVWDINSVRTTSIIAMNLID